jgi:hypothetical protein
MSSEYLNVPNNFILKTLMFLGDCVTKTGASSFYLASNVVCRKSLEWHVASKKNASNAVSFDE